jgi:hypothetical protein
MTGRSWSSSGATGARAGFGPIKCTPTLFLIDRRGTVRLKHLGVLPDGALEAQIKALLKQ